MPRAAQNKQFLNFVAGLNTESSPLVFPENTAKSLDNVDLQRDGSIKRRRGIDFETGGAYSTTTFTEADLENFAVSTFEWTSVGGDDSLNFMVIQVGGVLYFHDLGGSALSTSIIGSLDFDPIKLDDTFTSEIFDYDSAKGALFVVGRSISPAYIKYDADTNRFRGVKITVKIRDTDGIDEAVGSPIADPSSPPGTDPEDDFGDVPDFTEDPDDITPFIPIPPPLPLFHV